MTVLLAVVLALQEEETERPSSEPSIARSLLERSHLDLGISVTSFDGDLDMDERVGFYLRFAVPIIEEDLYITVDYRHAEGSNRSDVDGEDVKYRSFLLGALYRWDVLEDLDIVFLGEFGFGRLDSNLLGDDTGFLFALQAGVNIDISEILRVRSAFGLDLMNTDFHDDDDRFVANFSWVLGFDIGF